MRQAQSGDGRRRIGERRLERLDRILTSSPLVDFSGGR
jgi:hypothetical protein